MQEEFARRLKDVLYARGMSESGLARRLYVSRKTVCYWCTGKGVPSVAIIPDMCRVLNISADYLILGKGDLKWT